jgi:hypothetical protein
MIRRIATLTLATLLTAPLVGCDRPGEKEQNAEGRANMQAQQAQDQAANQAAAAQAQADQKIAAARIDFEKVRDDYRLSRESDLAALNKKLSDLDLKDKSATGQTKANLDQKLPAVRAQRDAFITDLRRLDYVTAATWDTAKDNTDKEWDALQANVNQL